MKLPAFQFYPGDWMKDPELSMCSPATRGIWIDLLCAMHELDRCGEIRGTLAQIARLCRCSVSELQTAIAELSTTRTADVAWADNTTVVVQNRRMRGEFKGRRNATERQQRKRSVTACHGNVTPPETVENNGSSGNVTAMSRNSHGNVAPYSSSSHPLRGGKNAPAREGGAAFSLKPENKSPPPDFATVADELRAHRAHVQQTGNLSVRWGSVFTATLVVSHTPGLRKLAEMDEEEFSIAIQTAYGKAVEKTA